MDTKSGLGRWRRHRAPLLARRSQRGRVHEQRVPGPARRRSRSSIDQLWSQHLRLPSDAVRFYRWRLEQAGPAPIQQTEAAVRSLLDDPAKLGRRHPEAARHLAAAFERLWTDPFDDNTLIETGGSLRSALTALTADLVGHTTSPEKVVSALKPWLNEPGRLPPRHPDALVALIDWAVRCAQRINHLHDERASGEPDPSWDEARRTAFTVRADLLRAGPAHAPAKPDMIGRVQAAER